MGLARKKVKNRKRTNKYTKIHKYLGDGDDVGYGDDGDGDGVNGDDGGDGGGDDVERSLIDVDAK